MGFGMVDPNLHNHSQVKCSCTTGSGIPANGEIQVQTSSHLYDPFCSDELKVIGKYG